MPTWTADIKAGWRRLRRGLKMTQADVSRITGESRSTCSRWENPKYPDYLPSLTALYAVARCGRMPPRDAWAYVILTAEAGDREVGGDAW